MYHVVCHSFLSIIKQHTAERHIRADENHTSQVPTDMKVSNETLQHWYLETRPHFHRVMQLTSKMYEQQHCPIVLAIARVEGEGLQYQYIFFYVIC